MSKSILARDLRVGDVVRSTVDRGFLGTRGGIVDVKGPLDMGMTFPMMDVTVKLEGMRLPWRYNISPEEVFILMHRPWPEGKTAQQMREPIDELMWEMTGKIGHPMMDHMIAQLRDAIDIYELGKPLK